MRWKHWLMNTMIRMMMTTTMTMHMMMTTTMMIRMMITTMMMRMMIRMMMITTIMARMILYDSDHTGAAFGIHVNESVSELPEDIDTISCSYELSFANPENLSEGYNFFMNLGYDEAPSALMAVSLNYSQQQEAGTESAALSLSIDADGESVYSATPYVMQFDSASNELAAQFSITDSDTNEIHRIVLLRHLLRY